VRRGLTGRYEVSTTAGERVEAVVTDPLPPVPPLDLSGALQNYLVVARELTGKRRNRVFAYDRYLALLAAGT